MATPKTKKEVKEEVKEVIEDTNSKLNKDGLVPNQLIDDRTYWQLVAKQRLSEKKA